MIQDMMQENKRDTHFTDLMGCPIISDTYFKNKSFDDYNYEKWNELRKNAISEKEEYEISSQLKSTKNFKWINKLEIFESDLAYLILSGKIQSTEQLGFSAENIKEILNSKIKEVQDSFYVYDYSNAKIKTNVMN